MTILALPRPRNALLDRLRTIQIGVGARGAVGAGLATKAGGAAAGSSIILHDHFSINQAAPIGPVRVCDPGPGTLTVEDPDNRLYISGDRLCINSSAVFTGQPSCTYSVSRVPGRTIEIRAGSLVAQGGLYITNYYFIYDGVQLYRSTGSVARNISWVWLQSFKVVLHDQGHSLFYRLDDSNEWELVDNHFGSETSQAIAGMSFVSNPLSKDAGFGMVVDYIKVYDT